MSGEKQEQLPALTWGGPRPVLGLFMHASPLLCLLHAAPPASSTLQWLGTELLGCSAGTRFSCSSFGQEQGLQASISVPGSRATSPAPARHPLQWKEGREKPSQPLTPTAAVGKQRGFMPQTRAVLRVQQSIPAAVLPPHSPTSPESHQRPSKQQQGDVGRLPTSSFGLWGERGTKLGGWERFVLQGAGWQNEASHGLLFLYIFVGQGGMGEQMGDGCRSYFSPHIKF